MLGVIDNRIDLLARLGEGDLESVLLGRERSTTRLLQVRELRKGFFDDPEAFEFFRNEYEYAARIRHPVIPREFSLRVAEDGRVFVIAEYITGTPLQALLDRLAANEGRLPPDVALYIAGEVGRALHCAHELRDEKTGEAAGVLHLDVCPSTIFISPTGTIHLKGLTISRARMRRGPGDRPGRLPYLAPERIEGGYLDRRTDLFSLGAVLFEMLAGAAPFPGSTIAEIRGRIATADCDFSLLKQPGMPSSLIPILQRALARTPADRHHGLGVFAADLNSVLSEIKSVKPRQALAGLLTRIVEPELLAPPEEDSAPVPETITTEILVRQSTEDERTPVEPVKQPAPPPTRPKPLPKKRDEEPIAALAKGDLLEKRPPVKLRVPPRKQPERKKRLPLGLMGLALGAIIVVLLILDFVVGFTPMWTSNNRLEADPPKASELVSVPARASIYINDRYSGRTPHEITRWTDGVTTIRLELDGYVPAETTLVIEEGRVPELPVVIFERRLSVRSLPPGAEVFIQDNAISGALAAGYMLRAADTVAVGVRKPGFNPPNPISISCTGPVGDYDTTRWIFEDRIADAQMELTGLFSRLVTVSSRPAGAAIYLDDGTVAAAVAGQELDLTLGRHKITLRLSPFLDYSFEIDVTEDSPDRYAPVLSRYVRITAVDTESGGDDIGADISWVRRNEQLIKSEDDRLQTPYSLKLQAVEHEVLLRKKGYRDTIVVLGTEVNVVAVYMSREEEDKQPEREEPKEFRWVQFNVERSGDGVSGATVIGYEKNSGLQYEFGTTGAEGKILVKVPPGKYDFVAVKSGERSRVNGERIKLGKDTKSVKLRFR